MQIDPPAPTTSISRAARAPRGVLLAASALACAALLSACGSSSSSSSSTATKTVNSAQVERSIEESVLRERHITTTVVCPTAVPATKGQTFECIATSHTTTNHSKEVKTPFVVTVQNSSGFVKYVGK
jgi:uncharacterized cupredoxin-like copper-binding protein